MQRGEDKDYYHQLQYRRSNPFMPRQLITQDKGYSLNLNTRQQLLNTLLYAYDELQIGKKWNVRVNGLFQSGFKEPAYTQALPEPKRDSLRAGR